MSREQLDARRLLCPMPVIEVICTDPGALNDIPAWARINGHAVIESQQEDNEIRITVRVGA